MRWAIVWILLIGLVLVPFVLFEAQFTAFAERMTATQAGAGLAASTIFGLLSFDVLLPVPSSIVSTAAGVLFGFWRGAALVWTGMMVGALLGYALGRRVAGAAARFVGEDGLRRAAALVERYGDWTLVMCRPVPVLAEATVMFAGLVRAPFGRFLLLTALANLGIAVGYAAFGAYSMRIDSFLAAFFGALLIPGAALLIARAIFGSGRRRTGGGVRD